MKKLKVASYNISGGFYIGNEDTEYLDRTAAKTFDNKLLNQIVETINNEDIDIICFQEIITTDSVQYIQKIVDSTNLKYYEFFELSPCNIVENTDCGLAILSKEPIDDCIKGKFPNPMLAKTTSSGKTYYTYDKGYMVCTTFNGMKVLTHHGFPYRRFNSTPEQNVQVFEFFDNKIREINPDIITGDFNAENFMDLIVGIGLNYERTIQQITTVDGKSFDDILIRKGSLYNSKMIKLLSDHFMIITEIIN